MSSEAEFHRNLRSKIADRIANNPKSDYAEGDELYLPSGTKVIFISDLLTHRKGKDDGAQRAYVRLPDGSESSVFLRDLSPEPPQRESTPAQLVSRLLEDPSAWQTANRRAEGKFGEFGLATCSEEEMNEIVDIKALNVLARKEGEHGFATMDEKDMERLLNAHPNLLRT
jgi:hypothetical protein